MTDPLQLPLETLIPKIEDGTHSPEDVMAAATDMARHIAAQAPLSGAGNRDLLRALQAGEVGAPRIAAHEEARRRAYASEDHYPFITEVYQLLGDPAARLARP